MKYLFLLFSLRNTLVAIPQVDADDFEISPIFDVCTLKMDEVSDHLPSKCYIATAERISSSYLDAQCI